jgi:hypothetical protein
MATTLRVKEATRARAAAIAARTGRSIGDVVDQALDAYEIADFWRRTRRALAQPNSDSDPVWDGAIRDNLDHG